MRISEEGSIVFGTPFDMLGLLPDESKLSSVKEFPVPNTTKNSRAISVWPVTIGVSYQILARLPNLPNP